MQLQVASASTIKCEGLALLPEHKRKNTTADIKKWKRLNLTEAMQTMTEQVNHEDTDEDSQVWSTPTPHTLLQPNYDDRIKMINKIKRNMRCMLKGGRIRFRTKKLKIGAWVNDLMVNNPLMTIPPINWFPVMAMPTKTYTPRNDNKFKMDTDSATKGIDNRCSLWISHIFGIFYWWTKIIKKENQRFWRSYPTQN